MVVTQLAAELAAQGRDIIALAAGEPDFDTPEHIRDAAIQAINAGKTRYTAVDGIGPLRMAIAAKFSRDNGLEYAPDMTIVSSGAKQLCYGVCQAVLDDADEALVLSPYWVSYPEMIRLAGASPVIVSPHAGAGFKITPDQLQQAITPRTRLLFINSPCNPSGAVYSRAELQALGAILAKHPKIVIASDEIYEHVYWGDTPYTSFASACPDLAGRTLTINGVSKSYAMTGWRIGFAGGPPALVGALRKIQSQSTTSACTISQYAALAALEGNQGCVTDFATAYKRRHDLVVEELIGVDGVKISPAVGAFYAFPDVSGAIAAKNLKDDTEFCLHLLDSTGVALVPGAAFGAPGHVRISFAADDSILAEGLGRLSDFASR